MAEAAVDEATGVWQQPDEAYRMTRLEVLIEGQSITENPPTYVKECPLAASNYTDHYEMTLVVFDETWVTIPALLRLGLNEDRVTDIVLSMGWPFAGGALENLQGHLLTMKQNITPEGIEYTLRGRIGPVPTQAEGAFKSSYVGNISDIVTDIATNVYKVPTDQQVIEPTKGDPAKKWPVVDRTASKFLAMLAGKAKPAQKAVPPGMTEQELSGLYGYVFNIDRDGFFHFHTLAYGLAYGSASLNPVKVTYPYPTQGNPVVELDIADVQWNELRINAATMDRTNPDLASDEAQVGPTGAESITDIYPVLSPDDTDEWRAFIEQVQSNMASRSFSADIVLLGNPQIVYGTPFDVQIVGGDLQSLNVLSHLSGIYTARQVVHAVAQDTFVTRCNLQKYYTSN